MAFYLLLQTAPGAAQNVLAAAGRLPSVRGAAVRGAFDVVLNVSDDETATVLIERLTSMPEVLRVLPCRSNAGLRRIAVAPRSESLAG